MSTREWGVGYDEGYQKGWNDAMDQKPAEALAQPEQEPVAWAWALTDDDLEKFTELIVRECAEIATKNQYEDCYAGYYVLQEFGIDY